jgi:sugar phosphate isomerase/epimerase
VVDALRVAAPRGGLTDPGTIDRTIDNARKAFLLASDLGVKTVSLNVGDLGHAKTPNDTVVAAIRELAQHADAAGLTMALAADGAMALAGLLKQVDYEGAKINLDGARLIGEGEDALKAAEFLEGHVGQLTAADAIRSGHTTRAVFLGEGQLALPELWDILREQGFRGPLVVDVRDLPDAAAGARHAAKVLERILRR